MTQEFMIFLFVMTALTGLLCGSCIVGIVWFVAWSRNFKKQLDNFKIEIVDDKK